MRNWSVATLILLLATAGCSSHRSEEESNARIHPADSVPTASDTATAHIRDSMPDTTGQRDTTANR
jgi:uncharacterized protein YcfL